MRSLESSAQHVPSEGFSSGHIDARASLQGCCVYGPRMDAHEMLVATLKALAQRSHNSLCRVPAEAAWEAL